jgi:hypothetical protein
MGDIFPEGRRELEGAFVKPYVKHSRITIYLIGLVLSAALRMVGPRQVT